MTQRSSASRLSLVVALAVLPLVAAKGGGCSTEIQPGDGSADSWELGPVPEQKGALKPMSCEWLNHSNCWTEFVDSVKACAPLAETGTFDKDRENCSFGSGAMLELEGPIGRPAKGSTRLPIVNHRVLASDGTPCLTAKSLAPFKTALASRTHTVVLESTGTLTYKVICDDGAAYGDGAEGSCSDVGLRWLGHHAPGNSLLCSGDEGTCTLELWGASATSSLPVATCKD